MVAKRTGRRVWTAAHKLPLGVLRGHLMMYAHGMAVPVEVIRHFRRLGWTNWADEITEKGHNQIGL